MLRLKVYNLKIYGSQEEELKLHLEENYYPYCRMELNEKYLVDDILKEMGNN